MKALFVTNGYYNNPNNLYKFERLKKEFANFDIECELKDAISLIPLCMGDKIELDLSSYFFAIDMDKDKYLAKVLSLKLPLFNSYESMMLSDDKMLSILKLKDSGISVPKTIPSPLCYLSNPDKKDVNRFLDRVEKELSYPMVFKECHGSLGRQVLLIKNRKELEETEEKYRHTQHLYEEFLKKNQGTDYRIIVIGNKVIACMKRFNENDFRSNIALGGKGYDVTTSLSDEFKEVALKASRILGLDYAGIDIGISDDGKPMFIEANGNAFFTEIEEITKINIAKALAEHIIDKILNKKQ